MTGQLAQPARRVRLAALRRWWLNRQLAADLRELDLINEALFTCYQSGSGACQLELKEKLVQNRISGLRSRIDALGAA